MLFFRSEEQVAAWCSLRRVPKRPLVSLDQLWQLALAWYESRLRPDARRPAPREMREIFGRVGLGDPFWDPTSDAFR
jgi:hypothetical protein